MVYMCARVYDKKLAIQLRRSGKTYSEIRERIPYLSKGTLSHWINSATFSREEERRINERATEGRNRSRLAAAQTNRLARLARTEQAETLAANEFIEFIRDPLFTVGLALYWGEGSKKSSGSEIINSDPMILKIMIQWAERFLHISRESLKARLYMHRQYANENLETFWIRTLKLQEIQMKKTIFKKSQFEFKKNQAYKGCLRIHLGGIHELRKIFHWQKMIAQYLKIE